MMTWFGRRRRGSVQRPGNGNRRRRPTVEPLEERRLLAGITEFGTGMFGSGTSAAGITQGADGNLWFAEQGINALGRITPSGTVTQFFLPNFSAPQDITSGPNGLLYFTENGLGTIGSMDPRAGSDANIQASLTESAVVPSGSGAGLEGITTGSDGNLWFTEFNAGNIGKITPDLGTITEIPTTNAGPGGIAPGPDHALWFTESSQGRNFIGRITTAGKITGEFAVFLASADNLSGGITAGPDGNLWFTAGADSSMVQDQVGRITTSGTITEFPVPPLSGPQGITAGPDGNLWFAEFRDQIGRISPAGVVTEYGTGITAGSEPDGIVTGADGNLWFTENFANRIGRLIPDAALTATGTSLSAVAAIPFNGPVASFTDGDVSAVPERRPPRRGHLQPRHRRPGRHAGAGQQRHLSPDLHCPQRRRQRRQPGLYADREPARPQSPGRGT